jgi:uncharacterized protein (TIGR02996 family)
MPSGRLELLAAIRAHPDDDAPRLAFADWLDQQGESDFARLIRLELERDRLPRTEPRRRELNEQALALWRKMPADCRPAGVTTLMKRGLPWYIDSGVLALRDAIDRLGPYAPQPFVFLSGNRQPHNEAEAELAQGGPDRIGVALRELFGSRWVREWFELQLDSIRLTEERIRWMTGPGNLTGLEVLSVKDGADDDAVRALCQADLPRLHTLAIQEVRRGAGGEPSLLTTATVLALLDSPLLARLEGLILFGYWLEDDGLLALAESSRVAGLKSLFVWPQTNSSAGVRALLKSPHLAGLTRLDLSGSALDPEMVALLKRPDLLPNLRRLIIAFNDVSYRNLLRPRFGEGLFAGSDQEEPQGEFAEMDEDDPGELA